MSGLMVTASGVAWEVWKLFLDAAFYILFGLFISGILEATISREKIGRYLGKPGMGSVWRAALIGIPLPLCSCGVIPTAVSLRKGGASKGAVLSFLISTPESDIDSIALSYALLDPLTTVSRVAAGMFSAITAGACENIFGKKDPPAETAKTRAGCVFCHLEDTHSHPWPERFRFGLSYAFTDLLCDIGKWLALGIVVSGVISYFVPASFIAGDWGYSPAAFIIALAAGIPMYICATASTPIAASLILKGMSPGAALVFLLVGPATNAATILMVSRFLGTRSAAIYLISLSACAVTAGVVLNAIYLSSGIDVRAQMGTAGEVIPEAVRAVSAGVLLFLMVRCQLVKKDHCGA